MILTLICAIQTWRRHPNRLYVVLVNHNISYYTFSLRELTLVLSQSPIFILCLEVISLTNILASLFLKVCESFKCLS
jgi:hypothetical protein